MEFRKAWKAFVGVVVGALFLVATVAFAAPPDKVDLSKYKGTKSGVQFDHKKHVDGKIDCAKCHHKPDGAKKEASCGNCHKEGAAVGVKDAFHKQCKDCHSKGGKGPTKCGECHK